MIDKPEQSNIFSNVPEKKPEENLALVPLRPEEEFTFRLDLTENQKKAWMEKAVEYLQKHSIPYNRRNLAQTDREILSKLRDVFIDVWKRSNTPMEKIGNSTTKLKSALDKGLDERQRIINIITQQLFNWSKKYFLDEKNKDFISPLAINYREYENILQRNQYLQADLSSEIKLSAEISNREKYFEELMNDLIPILQKKESFTFSSKKPDLETKAKLLRTTVLNYVKFNEVSSIININNLTISKDKNTPDDFLLFLWKDKFTQIPLEKWEKIEIFLNDFYKQTQSRVNFELSNIQKAQESNDLERLKQISRRSLQYYLNVRIPTRIIDERLEKIAEKLQLTHLWEKGKTLAIGNYYIPTIENLMAAKKEKRIVSDSKDPDLEKINQAISAWEEYNHARNIQSKNILELQNEIKLLQQKIDSDFGEFKKIDGTFRDKFLKNCKGLNWKKIDSFWNNFKLMYDNKIELESKEKTKKEITLAYNRLSLNRILEEYEKNFKPRLSAEEIRLLEEKKKDFLLAIEKIINFSEKYADLSELRRKKGIIETKLKDFDEMKQFVQKRKEGQLLPKEKLEKLLATKLKYLEGQKEYYENKMSRQNIERKEIDLINKNIGKLESKIQKYSKQSIALEKNKLSKSEKMILWHELYTKEQYLFDMVKIEGIRRFQEYKKEDLRQLLEKTYTENLTKEYKSMNGLRMIIGKSKNGQPIYGSVLSFRIEDIEGISRIFGNKLDEEQKKKHSVMIDFLNSPPFAPILQPMSIEEYYLLKEWILNFINNSEIELPIIKQKIYNLSVELNKEGLVLDLELANNKLLYWEKAEFRDKLIEKMKRLNMALEIK